MSNTRLPAAKVFCSPVPRFASAMTGPKLLMSATVQTSAPSKPMVPDANKDPVSASIPPSSSRVMAPVTACAVPPASFRRRSCPASASVRWLICARRCAPSLYCRLSRTPRRLSSTKPFRAPNSARKFSPDLREPLAAATGTPMPIMA